MLSDELLVASLRPMSILFLPKMATSSSFHVRLHVKPGPYDRAHARERVVLVRRNEVR